MRGFIVRVRSLAAKQRPVRFSTVRWTPQSLTQACQGQLKSIGSRPLSTVFIDSRRPVQNGVYVPIVAARDGHTFIEDAIRGGASGVLLMRDQSEQWISRIASEITVVEVEETSQALTILARNCCKTFGGPVVAVTGSNGKTTTRSYIESIVARRFDPVLATKGNLNNQLGVPLTVLGEPHDPAAKVLELGMSAIGENRHLAEIVRPTIAVITSIGLEHLETMKDLATIARAEAETVEFLPKDGALVIPDSEPLLEGLIPRNFEGRIYRFGSSERADVRILDVALGDRTCVHVELADTRTRHRFQLHSFGHFNARNASAAICVGRHLEIRMPDMINALESVQSVGDRGRILNWHGHRVVADCYNANPASMSAALFSLAEMAKQSDHRSIAILGDMLELGPEEIGLHASLGREVVDLGIDVVLGLGTLTRHTIDAARAQGHTCAEHMGEDPRMAIDWLKHNFTENPEVTLLIKGSRGMRLERIFEFWPDPGLANRA